MKTHFVIGNRKAKDAIESLLRNLAIKAEYRAKMALKAQLAAKTQKDGARYAAEMSVWKEIEGLYNEMVVLE
jgi:hypothetical protein